MPTTAREFSNLADASVQKCLEIADDELRANTRTEPPPFIVVAMGKHGGRELNYSSDIDLLFVCADESRAGSRESGDRRAETVEAPLDSRLSTLDSSHRLAELVIQYLTKSLQNGHLFRVDMRLRPEGRFGALVRTLSSYRAYYESWAEPWERQALIKARVVAGDRDLGEAFEDMVTPYVYRGRVTSDFVESIRRNKERIEQKAHLAGEKETNVKVGEGGIRDIEFTAQLLQLELGGRYPQIRSANTLEALGRLRQIGTLSAQEADELADDYRFLRTVEHRLQILYELQTQSLPTDPSERRLLARRLGFADAAEFDAEYERRTRRVRGHCERLFYGSTERSDDRDRWSELLAPLETDAGRSGIQLALDAEGFRDPARALQSLRGLAFGSSYGETTPETRELFLVLAGRLIEACARTGDPDAGLRGIEALALASPNPAALYHSLLEGEDLLERLTRMSAGSLPLAQLLARHPEWLDMLVSEEAMDPQLKPSDRCREELEERVSGTRDQGRFHDAVALYVQRERLRIGARDLWGELGPIGVMRELTALAEATLSVLLDRAVTVVAETHPVQRGALDSIALIGLGKLGGRELGYTSDWDLIAVYGGLSQAGPETRAAVEEVVSLVLSAGPELTARGAEVEIDARLRPEGRVGALAHTSADYERYLESTAEIWERQVLTRARPVAGHGETASSFMELRDRAIYSAPLTEDAVDAIRAMKRRIETERLRPENRRTNLKLGWGGMTDIEFLTQLLQLRHGSVRESVRVSDTVKALNALGAIGALPAPDANRLSESFTFYSALRNRLALMGGAAAPTLPSDPHRLRSVAIALGVVDSDSERAEAAFRGQFEERMAETRAVFERRFYQ